MRKEIAKKRLINKQKKRRQNLQIGRGLLNTIIDNLPMEVHIPGFQYCGPGTRLQKRYNQGQRGINKLDNACMYHDMAYAKDSSIKARNIADRQLEEAATTIIADPETGWIEGLLARAVRKVMQLKQKYSA